MAYMIIRIEPKHATYTPTLSGDCPPEFIEAFLTKRHANREPDIATYEALLNSHGWELGPFIGPVSRSEMETYPFTAYCFVSPNKKGRGRGASTLHRWPVRRKQ